ncbi:hypothetical protein MPNT_190012 [Candidatus Methylacidithermus pantelleriae]|uniref:Uncharacterized protein n=1 Tax=Candidatus Methylacidithermus pantelleriae TaxID=2744239 RepID=A0A8J2BSH4_9BACT|nr:hypothetical protein MPNT_190012 [Candidatus Methylacidithermus pantelleriae]
MRNGFGNGSSPKRNPEANGFSSCAGHQERGKEVVGRFSASDALFSSSNLTVAFALGRPTARRE